MDGRFRVLVQTLWVPSPNDVIWDWLFLVEEVRHKF